MNELEIFEMMKYAEKRYNEQRYIAKQRKIEWLYTFESWWQQWQESGKWEQRGRKTGEYVMARFGDVGPYSPTNVEIVTCHKNSSDAHKGKPNGRKGKTMEEIYGVEMAEQLKDNLRKINTGIKQSDATRAKKSVAFKGKPWPEARRLAYEKKKALKQ